MKHYLRIIISIIAIFAGLAAIQLLMGRSFFGPDNMFGWWTSSIWSNEQSQRLADPYSLSHIIHGLAFYAILWLFARKMPVWKRLLLAFLMEAGWEILENTSFIIERYRAVTISLGYYGDSILNSLGDMLMMGIGFFLAYTLWTWQGIAFVFLLEIILLFWVRDNLTINIIMLIYPIEAIKNWQLMVTPMV